MKPANPTTGNTSTGNTTTGSNVLELDDVHITYRLADNVAIPAVRGLSLCIGPGETVGLAGESGCGKSTIANAILRLLPPTTDVRGTITLDGHDVMSMKPGALRAVRWTAGAIVFQGALHSLNPVQQVGDQISEAIVLHQTGGATTAKAARPRVQHLLELVGLPAERAQSYPHQLSGGQRQRVLIALALACKPKILIADEPTTALDVMVQAQVLELLAELQREHDMALLFITHDLSVLTATCQRLAVMYAGRVVEVGPSGDVFAEPAHPYTAALATAFPTIGDAASRLNPKGLLGDPPNPVDLPTGCTFHPRCDVATQECSAIDVRLRRIDSQRQAACIRVGAEVAEAGVSPHG